MAIEQITGEPTENAFLNDHMNRGHEQEPEARALYESETFTDVSNGGFFCDDLRGCSPDGLVSEDGLIEIKSEIKSVYYVNVKRGSLNPTYIWQHIGNLHWTMREWIDSVMYCADYPEGKRLFVFRTWFDSTVMINREKIKMVDAFGMINRRTGEFLKLIAETKDNILTSEYFIK